MDIAINLSDDRASYKAPFEDTSIFSTSKTLSQEETACVRLRLRYEARTLFACPSASHAEAIEGIIMQRFFGSSRSTIQKHYRRRDDHQSSIQPMDNVVSRLVGTPELFAAVLPQLPAFNLISLTRVSKTFRHLIHNLPTLLGNLFLLPQKTPFEIQSLATHDETSLNDRSEQSKDYKIVWFCPLLHMECQSNLTTEERFEFEEHELAVINERAAHADFFTNMYLTNPPCVEVDIELIYKGIELGNRYPFLFEDKTPDTNHIISATRKIRNKTGVVFAMLMEATDMKGCAPIIRRVDKFRDRRTPEEDGGTPQSDEGALEEEYEPWVETRVAENRTLHDEIRAWEEKNSSLKRLDLASIEVKLHGVIVRTAADFAAIEKADRDVKTEEEQRKIFQVVLLEFKQKMSDRS